MTLLVKQYCTELYPTDAEEEIGKVGQFAVYEAADVEALLRALDEQLGELAPNNYDHADVVALNNSAINVSLAIRHALKGAP